jgi:beta-glucanase (GH16 family)
MNILKLFLLSTIAIFTNNTFAQCTKNYQLYWSDEFDSTALNTNKWVPQQGGGGFGNQEIQYYQPQNASVSNGQLHIKMANDTVVDGSTTYYYTSAKLQTAGKYDFLYGKMEASIKMPDAIGSWPAFWMLGSNIGDVGWPHCGEIDIMEWVGRGPDVATGSIFFDGTWPDNHLSTPYNIPQGQSFITDFHTFAIEWEPNEIRYYCDGNKYATYTNTSIAPKEWVFNHNFYLILNCAIGGTGGGGTIKFNNPQYMEVDYVRVYSLPTTADSIIITGPKSLMQNTQNVLYKTNYFPNTTYTWTLPNGATIVDGQGTNTIHVNYTTKGGKIKVSANNSCATLSDSLTVSLLADTCRIMYDNFDDTINVSYAASGTIDEKYANPSQDANNPSSLVAQYQRNILETYDVLGINDIALENALLYENRSRIFYMDLYTGAPIGTQIILQLENSSLNAGAYPQGRRSKFVGTVGKQKEWHTVEFKYNQIINSATDPASVDHLAILFDPGNLTGDTFYFDNLRRLRISSDCGFKTTAVVDANSENSFTVFPNPASDYLYINDKKKNQTILIYNSFGEKILETTDLKIDVSQFSNGIYLLKTENGSVRFIKQ